MNEAPPRPDITVRPISPEQHDAVLLNVFANYLGPLSMYTRAGFVVKHLDGQAICGVRSDGAFRSGLTVRQTED